MPELSVSRRVSFSTAGRGRRVMEPASEPQPVAPSPLPRVTRLMAMAIRMDDLIASGAMADQAEIALSGSITRARATQVMNLLRLAPDIQEAILRLPPVTEGRDPVTERDLRPLVAEICWGRQRAMWNRLRATAESPR